LSDPKPQSQAIDKWTECLALDPAHKSYNAKLLLNRGTAQAKLRHHQGAVDDCGKVGVRVGGGHGG
jgi:hypothetical protein